MKTKKPSRAADKLRPIVGARVFIPLAVRDSITVVCSHARAAAVEYEHGNSRTDEGAAIGSNLHDCVERVMAFIGVKQDRRSNAPHELPPNKTP